MKKFTFILSIILMAQVSITYAQDTETVNFTAILEDVLNLNVTGGDNQTATFNTPDTYNFGITDVGTTTVTVESTTNWNITIAAPDFDEATTAATIPINNLGLWLEATGAHTFGSELTTSYGAIGSACGVGNAAQTIVDNGTGNMGDATDNAFNLNWTMGTMNGGMNALSIFDQLSNGTIANIGTFTTTATLTLTAE